MSSEQRKLTDIDNAIFLSGKKKLILYKAKSRHFVDTSVIFNVMLKLCAKKKFLVVENAHAQAGDKPGNHSEVELNVEA